LNAFATAASATRDDRHSDVRSDVRFSATGDFTAARNNGQTASVLST
jgi:hypothetical protein